MSQIAARKTSRSPQPTSGPESQAGEVAEVGNHSDVAADARAALLKVGQDLADLGLRQPGIDTLLDYANKIIEISVAPDVLAGIPDMLVLAPDPHPIPDDRRKHLETVAAALTSFWPAPRSLARVLQTFVDQDKLGLSEPEVHAIAVEAVRRRSEQVDRTQLRPDCATASTSSDPSAVGSSANVPSSPDSASDADLALIELETATDEALIDEFRAAMVRGHLAALTAVTCIGRLMELRNGTRGAQASIARLTGLSQAVVSRYARIYSTVLKPLRSCGTTRLPFAEVEWYVHAVDLSRSLGRSPLDLLTEAVSLKRTDPSLSARAWRARLTAKVLPDRASSTESDGRTATRTSRSASERALPQAGSSSIAPLSDAPADAAIPLSQLTVEAMLATPTTKLLAQLVPSDHLDATRIARELLAKAQSLLELLTAPYPGPPALLQSDSPHQ